VGELKEDLGRLASELRETHISWVFLQKDLVLKVKKPVNFGFLDFTGLEQRRQACLAEVALNARLAPHVYLGVVPITRSADGRHHVGGSDPVVDWAVQMHRLADADRADLRLAEGRLDAQQIEKLAQVLVRFHEAAGIYPEIAEYGRVSRIGENVRENFAQAHSALAQFVSEAEQREVETWQLGFLDSQRERFERRIQSGRVRDGHGDLRLEHVYIDGAGEPTIIDCIEFNQRFRFADVCSDVAFLSMDLAFQGHVDHKERLLAAYATESQDHELYGVVDFYESYRAYIRAKVATLGLASAPLAERQRLSAQARRYFLLSMAAERPPASPPRLLAIAGVIASGKSSVARALGSELALPYISSDRLRKALRGVTANTSLRDAAFAANYSQESTEQVYVEMFRRAEVILASGRSVIVDASFRSVALRAAARASAARAQVPFLLIECRAPVEVSRARLAERVKGPSESDGRSEIFGDFLARWEPITELADGEHVVLDTGGTLERSLGALRRSGVL
jgi:aminoglycoside phosphotransferase family enzyme/predicted kinase